MKSVYSSSPLHQMILEVNKHSLVDIVILYITEVYCNIFLFHKNIYILIVIYQTFIEKLF